MALMINIVRGSLAERWRHTRVIVHTVVVVKIVFMIESWESRETPRFDLLEDQALHSILGNV